MPCAGVGDCEIHDLLAVTAGVSHVFLRASGAVASGFRRRHDLRPSDTVACLIPNLSAAACCERFGSSSIHAIACWVLLDVAMFCSRLSTGKMDSCVQSFMTRDVFTTHKFHPVPVGVMFPKVIFVAVGPCVFQDPQVGRHVCFR